MLTPNIPASVAARESGKSGCSSPLKNRLVEDSLIPQALAKSFALKLRFVKASLIHPKRGSVVILSPFVCKCESCASAQLPRLFLSGLLEHNDSTTRWGQKREKSVSDHRGRRRIDGYFETLSVQLLRDGSVPFRTYWATRTCAPRGFGGVVR